MVGKTTEGLIQILGQTSHNITLRIGDLDVVSLIRHSED